MVILQQRVIKMTGMLCHLEHDVVLMVINHIQVHRFLIYLVMISDLVNQLN
jgi:hypothetical protein